MDRPIEWFRHNVIATVPMQYRGAGRRVYPGFMQLAGFMSMNLGNHMMSHYEMFKHLTVGDDESAQAGVARRAMAALAADERFVVARSHSRWRRRRRLEILGVLWDTAIRSASLASPSKPA